VPGLIDAHMHVLSSEITRNPGFGPPPALKGGEPRARELGYFVLAAMAKAVLEAGITTVRDVGCDDYEAIVLRQAVNLGVVPGPQVLSCGRIISATSPGGVLFEAMYRQADGPDEVRRPSASSCGPAPTSSSSWRPGLVRLSWRTRSRRS